MPINMLSQPSQLTILSSGLSSANPDYLVSAIVSTYKSEKFIRGCLEDLVDQTLYRMCRMEIVIVDSASPEAEGNIIKEFMAKYPDITYLRTAKRETVYAAWNRAIENARGKYITNTNTDDRHRHDALERLAKALEAHPAMALCYADVAVTTEENKTFRSAKISACFRWPDYNPRLLFRTCYMGPQPMWRRCLHDHYGLFDPYFISAGDYEFWLRMAPTEQFLHLPEVLGMYLLSPTSVEHRNQRISTIESELARMRYWPGEWGSREPQPGISFLNPLDEAELQRLRHESPPPTADVKPIPIPSRAVTIHNLNPELSESSMVDTRSMPTKGPDSSSTTNPPEILKRQSELQSAIGFINQGEVGRAVGLIWPYVTLHLNRGQPPDPWEWSYLLVAILCSSNWREALPLHDACPEIKHPEVERVRWLIQAFRKGKRPEENPTILPAEEAAPTIHHGYKIKPFNQWLEHIRQMFTACGQPKGLDLLVDKERLKADQENTKTTPSSLPILSSISSATKDNQIQLVVDGVIFQLQAGRPLGISQVWKNLLPHWVAAMPNVQITLLRRKGSTISFEGVNEIEIPELRLGPEILLDEDDRRLSRICAELKADTFISTYYTRAPGFRNVMMVHDLIPEKLGFDLSSPEWVAKRRCISNAESYFAVSDSTRKDLIQTYQVPSDKITVTPLGGPHPVKSIDQQQRDAFLRQHHIQHPYFLLVGNRGLYKNSIPFLHALSTLEERDYLQVVAVGGGQRRSPEELNASQNINFLDIPYLPDEAMPAAYRGALALVYLSRYEGFGLPVLEAMAYACPVITSPRASLPEVGGDAVLYVNPDSIEEIAAALRSLLQFDLRSDLAERGRRRSRLFTWSQTAAKAIPILLGTQAATWDMSGSRTALAS